MHMKFTILAGVVATWFSISVLYAQPVKELSWRIVNDTVMGGISTSSITSLEHGFRFSGLLSLENNGGFVSVRSTNLENVEPEVNEVVIRVEGDGRTYYLDLRGVSRMNAFSYRASFETVAGEMTSIHLPLRDFVATRFGRRLPQLPGIRATDIRSVGFTLADGKSGPFRLDVQDIQFVQGEVEADQIISSRELIQQAISFGVPLYNDGQIEACAMIYEVALTSFTIDGHPEVTPEHQNMIRSALSVLPSDPDARA
jgi:hypothetical protein